MKIFLDKLKTAQQFLQDKGIDGWLLYDFKRLNSLACHFLELGEEQLLTRRFFYWIPKHGTPQKFVSQVENPLLHLPGSEKKFGSWQELEQGLKELLSSSQTIAMEYSPFGRVPEVSKVDAGMMELVRSFGVSVVSSGDLYQEVTATLTEEQQASQRLAAQGLDEIAALTWEYIGQHLDKITEKEAQAFILMEIERRGFISESPPIVAVGSHSADPHYEPGDTVIRKGDFILIDLWCKDKKAGSIYGDISRVGVAREPTDEEQKVFALVREAQRKATELVIKRFQDKKVVYGWEVDQAARDIIAAAGYGSYFVHRTGHNIHEKDHGPGCHIDNLETQEKRELLKNTCCSIEPGIYLPGKFGVRLEYDLLIDQEGNVEITGGIQEEITCIV